MTNSLSTYNSHNTSSKELIRKNIRHALANKNLLIPANIDQTVPSFTPANDLMKDFVTNYRTNGGRCLLTDKANFLIHLEKFISSQNYHSILCLIDHVAQHLDSKNIAYEKVLDVNRTVELAIVYADYMIARSGSLFFTQKFSLYPSVRNFAKDILVLGFASNIVPDLRNAVQRRRKYEENNDNSFLEVITPLKIDNAENQEIHSLTKPRFNLLLIS